MRNKKKAIFNTIFLILIFSITVYMVFKGEDLGEIIHTVRQADPVFLLIRVVCVVLFILGESVIIFYMMRTLGAKVKMGHCALYSFVGFIKIPPFRTFPFIDLLYIQFYNRMQKKDSGKGNYYGK